jgi:hypothetical protein
MHKFSEVCNTPLNIKCILIFKFYFFTKISLEHFINNMMNTSGYLNKNVETSKGSMLFLLQEPEQPIWFFY